MGEVSECMCAEGNQARWEGQGFRSRSPRGPGRQAGDQTTAWALEGMGDEAGSRAKRETGGTGRLEKAKGALKCRRADRGPVPLCNVRQRAGGALGLHPGHERLRHTIHFHPTFFPTSPPPPGPPPPPHPPTPDPPKNFPWRHRAFLQQWMSQWDASAWQQQALLQGPNRPPHNGEYRPGQRCARFIPARRCTRSLKPITPQPSRRPSAKPGSQAQRAEDQEGPRRKTRTLQDPPLTPSLAPGRVKVALYEHAQWRVPWALREGEFMQSDGCGYGLPSCSCPEALAH